jgi:hypothetical protein
MQFRPLRQAGQVQECGEEIHADGGLVGHGTWTTHPGGSDDQGNADAPFVAPAFSGPEGENGGRGQVPLRREPPVVGSEDHDGVFIQAEAVEFGKDPAHIRIHGAHHGSVFGIGLMEAGYRWPFLAGLVKFLRREAGPFFLVLGIPFVTPLDGGVDSVIGQV